jgi:hypothetical protein
MAGVGNKWTIDDFEPMMAIPTGVYLTAYSGGFEDFRSMPFPDLVAMVENGTLPLITGPVFRREEIVEAHRTMEENRADGAARLPPSVGVGRLHGWTLFKRREPCGAPSVASQRIRISQDLAAIAKSQRPAPC